MSIRCSWRTRTHSHDIDLTVEAAAQQILGADPVIGARFDPWRVGRETGRGGMGIVYLVVRDDAQFQKHAASSSSEPVWTRRNCSPEGRPFPAMDYGRCLPTPTCTSFWRKPIDGGTQNGRRERKKAVLM
jgi:hypothetical protein